MSSNITIVNYKELNFDKLLFNTPEKSKSGIYVANAKYDGEDLYIQSPKLKCTTLINTDSRAALDLEFDKSHGEFYDFITSIDDYSIIQIQKNSKAWFSKEFPLDVVEEFYKTPVKMGRKKNAPSLKIKVPVSKGEPNIIVYDNKNNVMDFSKIKENTKTLVVLRFIGLKFLKQQVICEWVPIQVKSFQAFAPKKDIYLIKDNLLTDDEYEHTRKRKLIGESKLNNPIDYNTQTISLEQIENDILPDNTHKISSSDSDAESTANAESTSNVESRDVEHGYVELVAVANVEVDGANVEVDGANVEVDGANVEVDGANVEVDGANGTNVTNVANVEVDGDADTVANVEVDGDADTVANVEVDGANVTNVANVEVDGDADTVANVEVDGDGDGDGDGDADADTVANVANVANVEVDGVDVEVDGDADAANVADVANVEVVDEAVANVEVESVANVEVEVEVVDNVESGAEEDDLDNYEFDLGLSDSELSEVDLITLGNLDKTVNIKNLDLDDVSQLKMQLKDKENQINELQTSLKDLLTGFSAF
jgi:hypothetical protein